MDPVGAALIGAGVGASTTIAAQFIAHGLGVRRDRYKRQAEERRRRLVAVRIARDDLGRVAATLTVLGELDAQGERVAVSLPVVIDRLSCPGWEMRREELAGHLNHGEWLGLALAFERIEDLRVVMLEKGWPAAAPLARACERTVRHEQDVLQEESAVVRKSEERAFAWAIRRSQLRHPVKTFRAYRQFRAARARHSARLGPSSESGN